MEKIPGVNGSFVKFGVVLGGLCLVLMVVNECCQRPETIAYLFFGLAMAGLGRFFINRARSRSSEKQIKMSGR